MELEVDNKETVKKLKEAFDELITSMDITCRSLEMIQNGRFSIEEYGRCRTDCLLEDRSKAKSKGRKLKKLVRAVGEAGSVNEQLRAELQEWRTARFKKDNIPAYCIMHQSTLMTIASLAPKTKAELLQSLHCTLQSISIK